MRGDFPFGGGQGKNDASNLMVRMEMDCNLKNSITLNFSSCFRV